MPLMELHYSELNFSKKLVSKSYVILNKPFTIVDYKLLLLKTAQMKK
jgi:hypothetical protein